MPRPCPTVKLSSIAAGLTLPVVVGLGIADAPAHGAPPHDPTVTLAWGGCHDGFECATVRVPLDYDRPHGRTTPLSVIRLPAADPVHRIGTLFLNPGGPGASGVTFALNAAHDVSQRVHGRFDIVSWDLRGTYGSAGLRCFSTPTARSSALAPFVFPQTRGEVAVQRRADRRLARACATRGWPIVDHMTTADHARDLDMLRAAVGDRQLSYYGASYGSVLGTTYANLFPRRVRALVVDSVMDPVQWTTGRPGTRGLPVFARAGSAAASSLALRHFFTLCDAASTDDSPATTCSFGPSSRTRFAALARRLKQHPVSIPGESGPSPFGYPELEATTVFTLYDASSWSTLADTLTALDQLQPARAALLLQRTGSTIEQYDDYEEAFRAITCADATTTGRTSDYARAARAFEHRYPYVGQLWGWIDSACAVFPGDSSDRYSGPWNARTAHPVLVVGTRYDPGLPYANAVALSRTLPRARLLTFNGVGHGSFVTGRSSCIDEAVGTYLVSTRPPPPGTVCQHDDPPFTTSQESTVHHVAPAAAD